jgi:hypothetical protein
MDSKSPHPYDMVNDITASLQEEDDFHPTKWNCSKCHFVNNDDESYCQKNIVGGNRCSTKVHRDHTMGSAFRGKAQTAANNEPRVSGSSNEAVCESTAGGLAEKKKKKKKKKTPPSKMLRELESTLDGSYWMASGMRGSRRR